MRRWWILLLSALLISCSPAKPHRTAPSVPQTSVAFTEEEGVLGIVADGVCRYRVIRPERCSETVRTAAQSIDTWLFDRLDTHIEVKNDFSPPSEWEILVGDTNRPESRSLLEGLSENEYAVACVGKKLVFCAHSDRGVQKAVEWFLEKYVKELRLTQGQTPRLIVSLAQPHRGTI